MSTLSLPNGADQLAQVDWLGWTLAVAVS